MKFLIEMSNNREIIQVFTNFENKNGKYDIFEDIVENSNRKEMYR